MSLVSFFAKNSNQPTVLADRNQLLHFKTTRTLVSPVYNKTNAVVTETHQGLKSCSV